VSCHIHYFIQAQYRNVAMREGLLGLKLPRTEVLIYLKSENCMRTKYKLFCIFFIKQAVKYRNYSFQAPTLLFCLYFELGIYQETYNLPIMYQTTKILTQKMVRIFLQYWLNTPVAADLRTQRISYTFNVLR
jgi:hypothetical protein